MLYAMLAACATLILVLDVPRTAHAHRLARLFRAQQEWAEMMDRHALRLSTLPLADHLPKDTCKTCPVPTAPADPDLAAVVDAEIHSRDQEWAAI